MARPNKQGLDYFPLDVNLLTNLKVRRLISAQGINSIAVIIELLCRIYQGKGYYIERSNDLAFLISDALRSGISEGAVEEIIKKAIELGFFDANMLDDFGILTSESIQKTFFEATKKRKGVQYDGRFLLISINGYNNLVNVDINSINVHHNEQSKEKKSKENKIKENKTKEVNRVVSYFMNHFGELTGFTADLLSTMVDDFGEPSVLDAMELAVNKGKPKLNYVQGILRNKEADSKHGGYNNGARWEIDWDNEPDELR